MFRKIAIGLGVVVLIAAGAAWYLFSNLDSYVKAAIEKYGSEATQTAVTVDSVTISIGDGEATVSGLKVKNPAGFGANEALQLGTIKVRLDTGSIRGTGPIHLLAVEASQPAVAYELNASGSGNLQAIQKNVMAYAGKMDTSGPERKLKIDTLDIRGGQVQARARVLQGKDLSLPLPAIHLTNIGKGDGATPTEVAAKVIGAITNEAIKVASQALTKQLESSVGAQIPPDVQSLGGRVKGLLGR